MTRSSASGAGRKRRDTLDRERVIKKFYSRLKIAQADFIRSIKGAGDATKQKLRRKLAPEDYALPTETWHEVISRRKDYEELRAEIAAGRVRLLGVLRRKRACGLLAGATKCVGA